MFIKPVSWYVEHEQPLKVGGSCRVDVGEEGGQGLSRGPKLRESSGSEASASTPLVVHAAALVLHICLSALK